MKATILLVDDEPEIAGLLAVYLKNEGYEVHTAATGEQALQSIRSSPPALTLLDVMLPDTDGFSLCRQIRETYFFPIIMLTARGEDLDKITGLSLGADDYIVKPFNPLEVVARVKTQLRRVAQYDAMLHGHVATGEEHAVRGLVIRKSSHTCTLLGRDLPLTPLEFDILWYLCENRGRVVSSEELFEKVWHETYLDSNNTVMAHIARLREKMHETPRRPKYIKTVGGVGYTIESEQK